MQVSEAMHRYGRGWACACCRSTAASRSAGSSARCERGVDVVVATPGRALDHIGRGTPEARRARRPSCSTRPTRCSTWASPRTSRRSSTRRPTTRQTVLFSATMPPRIEPMRAGACATRCASRSTASPRPATARRRSASPPTSSPARTSRRRSAACSTSSRPTAAIVFCRTRTEVDELTETLNGRGYRAEALHGGMTQDQRDRVMARLRNGAAELLVATDVAARGLDIDQLTHVVNYDVPSAPRPTSTASAASAAPGARASRSRSPSRASTGCSRRSSASPRTKITIEKLPTVADLRARRLELTRAARSRRLLVEGDLEPLPRRRRRARRRVRRGGDRAGGGQARPRGVRPARRRRGRDPRGPRRRAPKTAPTPRPRAAT